MVNRNGDSLEWNFWGNRRSRESSIRLEKFTIVTLEESFEPMTNINVIASLYLWFWRYDAIN